VSFTAAPDSRAVALTHCKERNHFKMNASQLAAQRSQLAAESAEIDALLTSAVANKSYNGLGDLEQRIERLKSDREALEFAELQAKSAANHPLAQQFGSSVDEPAVVVTKAATGRQVAPLVIDQAAMKSLHAAVVSRTAYATKGFNTANSHLPAQLHPEILGPIHENRLLDRLPTLPIQAPSYEYIRHTGTTGSAAITAEGAPKPELVFTIDHVIASVQKIAAHAGISWESLRDYDVFTQYLQQELLRQVIDVENAELLNGDGTTGHLDGLLATSGILTHARVAGERSIDSVDIAALRTGSSLAEPNLLVLHPNTWSTMRRTVDDQHRYLVQPDPTKGAVATLWGVEVLVTTVIAEGVGALLDTSKFGRALVRDSLSIQTGTSGDDFVHNITRFVCEERITLAVERPSAVLKLSNLGTDASDPSS
jgi:HK97 family phage major capsid protein